MYSYKTNQIDSIFLEMEDVSTYISLLKSSNSDIKKIALYALGALSNWDSIDSILDVLFYDNDDEVRASCINALSNFGYDIIAKELLPFLNDQSLEVKIEIIDMLIKHGVKDNFNFVVSNLSTAFKELKLVVLDYIACFKLKEFKDKVFFQTKSKDTFISFNSLLTLIDLNINDFDFDFNIDKEFASHDNLLLRLTAKWLTGLTRW